MNIVSEELDHVAAAAAPRMDMYSGIHKAWRALMADTLLAVGRMDVADEAELAAVTERVEQMLAICASHLKHENEHIHTAIEARAVGASEEIAHDHVAHVMHIDRLTRLAGSVRGAAAEARPVVAATLYRELSLFIAENFQHMHVEETAHNRVLWSRYTDAELVAVHDALIASIPPEEMMFTVRWLLPNMNPTERAMLAADIRGKVPAPAFDAMLEVARPHMSAGDWAKLMRALGMSPVPGLVVG